MQIDSERIELLLNGRSRPYANALSSHPPWTRKMTEDNND